MSGRMLLLIVRLSEGWILKSEPRGHRMTHPSGLPTYMEHPDTVAAALARGAIGPDLCLTDDGRFQVIRRHRHLPSRETGT